MGEVGFRQKSVELGNLAVQPASLEILVQADLHSSSDTQNKQEYANGERTQQGVKQLLDAQVDLILFVGGDGTARDVLQGLDDNQALHKPVLGIPAGVKMHSGVFAISPRAAANVVAGITCGEIIALRYADVRDFDRQAKGDANREISDKAAPVTRRQSVIAYPVRVFGELNIPDLGGYIQQTKVGGVESEPLVVEEICAHMEEALADHLASGRDLLFGPGSTCAAIKQRYGLTPTLRGFDLFSAHGQHLYNLTRQQIDDLFAKSPTQELPKIIMSFTRHQGFLFGRGNQQLGPTVLSKIDLNEHLHIVSTRTKLASLAGRPLLLDTGDDNLDQTLSGLVELICGYEDKLLYRLGTD